MNGKKLPAERFTPELFRTGISIYEVFRLIRGVPLFLGEHLERLDRSIKLIDQKSEPGYEDIVYEFQKLAIANGIDDGNVEIILNFKNDEPVKYIFLFIEKRDPTPKDYREGVGTLSFRSTRQDPQIKQINLELRVNTTKTISNHSLFEVILVKEDGLLTEGSRSNLFLIRENTVYTPPIEIVLPGITRQKIIDICRNENINLIERDIYIDEIGSFDSAFITGTSAKALPLKFLDKTEFNPLNPTLRLIIEKYDQMIDDYVHNFSYSGIEEKVGIRL